MYSLCCMPTGFWIFTISQGERYESGYNLFVNEYSHAVIRDIYIVNEVHLMLCYCSLLLKSSTMISVLWQQKHHLSSKSKPEEVVAQYHNANWIKFKIHSHTYVTSFQSLYQWQWPLQILSIYKCFMTTLNKLSQWLLVLLRVMSFWQLPYLLPLYQMISWTAHTNLSKIRLSFSVDKNDCLLIIAKPKIDIVAANDYIALRTFQCPSASKVF